MTHSAQKPPAPEPGGVSRAGAISGMILTFIGGAFFGALVGGWWPGREAPDADPAADVERTVVPVGLSPTLGPADALVTIVEFADMECPYCAKSVGLLKRVQTAFPREVRWVFKHFPLPMHRQSPLAAQASMEAHHQGRFWDYHEMIFHRQRELGPKVLEEMAWTLGLDMKRFRRVLGDRTYAKVVQEDHELGRKLGVRGTPTFFINGRKQVGFVSYGRFDALIRQEITHARSLLRQGTSRLELYETVMKSKLPPKDKAAPKTETKDGGQAPPSAASPPPTRQRHVARDEARAGELYQVRPGESPALGESSAPVTAILFADYQCPHSERTYRVLRELQQVLGGGRLRLVLKQFPMRRHAQAWLAAEAALAAQAQGKFWELSDALFSRRADLSRPVLLELAGKLGLDAGPFTRALDEHAHAWTVDRESAEAVRFGAIGTPSLYINGRFVSAGASKEALRELLVSELQRAHAALKSGINAADLYEHLIRDGRSSV